MEDKQERVERATKLSVFRESGKRKPTSSEFHRLLPGREAQRLGDGQCSDGHRPARCVQSMSTWLVQFSDIQLGKEERMIAMPMLWETGYKINWLVTMFCTMFMACFLHEWGKVMKAFTLSAHLWTGRESARGGQNSTLGPGPVPCSSCQEWEVVLDKGEKCLATGLQPIDYLDRWHPKWTLHLGGADLLTGERDMLNTHTRLAS